MSTEEDNKKGRLKCSAENHHKIKMAATTYKVSMEELVDTIISETSEAQMKKLVKKISDN